MSTRKSRRGLARRRAERAGTIRLAGLALLLSVPLTLRIAQGHDSGISLLSGIAPLAALAIPILVHGWRRARTAMILMTAARHDTEDKAIRCLLDDYLLGMALRTDPISRETLFLAEIRLDRDRFVLEGALRAPASDHPVVAMDAADLDAITFILSQDGDPYRLAFMPPLSLTFTVDESLVAHDRIRLGTMRSKIRSAVADYLDGEGSRAAIADAFSSERRSRLPRG